MYIVDCGKYHRYKFETLSEANKHANEILKRTKVIVGIYEVKEKEKKQ